MAALSCQRQDGSVTWQRQDGRLGAFFPLHDLTHYAVETVLAYRHGFWGLLAEGWDLNDFGKAGQRGPMPLEAVLSEFTVGFFDQERAAGVEWSATDFNASAAAHCAQRGVVLGRLLTDEELHRVRRSRQELFAQWATVPPVETLELIFRRGQAAA